MLEKKALHPVAIFKESWGLYLRNFRRLAGIYSIIYLPLSAVSLIQSFFPAAPGVNLFFLLWTPAGMAISIWGHLALLFFVSKITAAEGACGIKEGLRGAGRYFWPYIGASTLQILFISGIAAIIGVLGFGIAALLWEANKIMAILIPAVIITASVAVAVYFMIRWSIYGALSVIEGAGPVAALKGSYRLVKGYVNPVVGEYCLLILVSIVGSLPLMILGAIGGADNSAISRATIIYLAAINMALTPLVAAALVILYRKLKEAVEG